MTSYGRLFMLVEGEDDERFFENVLETRFRNKYYYVKIIKYATMRKEKIDNFIKSIEAMGADYKYVTDIDDAPCVTAKKQEVQKKFRNIDHDKIIVVVKEIESWYLAGLDDRACEKLKLKTGNIAETDDIDKEKFNALIPRKFTSRIDFLLEILKIFSVETAKQKNKSFKYCIEKCDC